jgi:hypothetical protein
LILLKSGIPLPHDRDKRHFAGKMFPQEPDSNRSNCRGTVTMDYKKGRKVYSAFTIGADQMGQPLFASLKIFGLESGEHPVFLHRGMSRSVSGIKPPQVSHLLNFVMITIILVFMKTG